MDHKRRSDHYQSVCKSLDYSEEDERCNDDFYDYEQANQNQDWNRSSPPKRQRLDDDDLSQQDYGYCPPASPNQVQREQGHHSSRLRNPDGHEFLSPGFGGIGGGNFNGENFERRLSPQRYRDHYRPKDYVDYDYSSRSVSPSLNHPRYSDNQRASYGIPGTSDGRSYNNASSSRSSCSDHYYKTGVPYREDRSGYRRNLSSPENRTPSSSPKGPDFFPFDTRSSPDGRSRVFSNSEQQYDEYHNRSQRSWFSESRNRDSFNHHQQQRTPANQNSGYYTDSQGPPSLPQWKRHSTELQNRPAFVHDVERPFPASAEGHSTEPAFVQHRHGERHGNIRLPSETPPPPYAQGHSTEPQNRPAFVQHRHGKRHENFHLSSETPPPPYARGHSTEPQNRPAVVQHRHGERHGNVHLPSETPPPPYARGHSTEPQNRPAVVHDAERYENVHPTGQGVLPPGRTTSTEAVKIEVLTPERSSTYHNLPSDIDQNKCDPNSRNPPPSAVITISPLQRLEDDDEGCATATCPENSPKRKKVPLQKKNVNSTNASKAKPKSVSKGGRGGATGGRKVNVTKDLNISSPSPGTSVPFNVTEEILFKNRDHDRKIVTKISVDKRDSPLQSPRRSTPNDDDGSEVPNMSDHFNDVSNVVESSQPIVDAAEKTMSKCPLCNKVMNNIEEHLSLYHSKRFACYLCRDVFELAEEVSTHIAEIHHASSQSSTEESNPIRVVFRKEKMSLTTYKFNRLKSGQKFTEVEVPGNGLCFTSAVLVGLWEQGVEKTYDKLVMEIMHEIKTHSPKYSWNKTNNDQVTSVSVNKTAVKACEDFIQSGIFLDEEYVDICIGSAANAFGINLNIIHKNRQNYNLKEHDCRRYPSATNIFLIFHQDAKRFDAHYNCLTSAEFYKTNKEEISQLMIQRQALDDTEKDMLLAQKLSGEQYEEDLAARQRKTRSSKSLPNNEER